MQLRNLPTGEFDNELEEIKKRPRNEKVSLGKRPRKDVPDVPEPSTPTKKTRRYMVDLDEVGAFDNIIDSDREGNNTGQVNEEKNNDHMT